MPEQAGEREKCLPPKLAKEGSGEAYRFGDQAFATEEALAVFHYDPTDSPARSTSESF